LKEQLSRYTVAFEAFWQYSFVRPSAADWLTVSTSSSGLDVDFTV
jgi:hypothetical protein